MKQTPMRKLRVDLADVENDRIHLKRNTVERFKRENAPVRLNGKNEITTLTELE